MPSARPPALPVPARLALLAAAALGAGCVTVHPWPRPTAEFAEGAAQAQATLGAYLRGLDDFERRVYLAERLYHPELPVAERVGGQPTPLLAVYPPEAIQARLDALEVLAAYGQRLSEVASSDAGATALQGGAALVGNARKLADRVGGAPAQAAAAPYVTPLATLVGLLADLWIEGQQDAALRKAVTQGAPAVRALLDQLQADLEQARTLQLAGAQQQVADLVVWYNEHRAELGKDLAARRGALDDLEAAERARATLASFDPTRVTVALRDAHEALVRLAGSPRSAEDARQATAALQAFVARVAAASKAAHALTSE